jgi:hypothetical protein
MSLAEAEPVLVAAAKEFHGRDEVHNRKKKKDKVRIFYVSVVTAFALSFLLVFVFAVAEMPLGVLICSASAIICFSIFFNGLPKDKQEAEFQKKLIEIQRLTRPSIKERIETLSDRIEAFSQFLDKIFFKLFVGDKKENKERIEEIRICFSGCLFPFSVWTFVLEIVEFPLPAEITICVLCLIISFMIGTACKKEALLPVAVLIAIYSFASPIAIPCSIFLIIRNALQLKI